MALAFKRAVADAEKAVEAANTSIKGWYSPPVNPALVVDYDGIKTVEGVSKQNPNEEEKPKNITLCNWVAENANNFHSVWGDVQYKDSANALPIMNKHVEKVVVHVDDKGVAGKYNSYSVEVKGKDVHITVHIDFTNYPQALNLTDETSGPSVDQLVWAHLDKVANISYELRKIALISGAVTTYQNYLKDKLKKDLPLSVDWDSVVALQGESLEYQDKPLVPNRARAINLLGDDGKAIYNAYYAIDGLCKDDMGTEAFLETFDKVVVSILPGPVVEDFSGAPKITKEGKTLKFEFQFATAYAGNARWDYSEMAKSIEALL